jgi:hypothetical protein
MSNVHPVDALGEIKAAIANLEAQAKVFHAQIVAMGVGAHEGDVFRATVSVADRDTLDMVAVREKLSPQFISAHTTTKAVTTVRVVARNGKAVAA